MLGLPGGEWAAALDGDPLGAAPAEAAWKGAGEIEHTFTHFHLTLRLWKAEVMRPTEGLVWTRRADALADTPSVFAKALRKALLS